MSDPAAFPAKEPAPPTRALVGRCLLLAAAYVGAAVLGLHIAPVGRFATLVWPPTGLAIAALRLFGYRLAPGVLLGAFVANVLTGAPLPAALGIATGNMLEALLAVYVLRRLAPEQAFDGIRHVTLLLFVAAPLAAAVSMGIGIGTLVATGVVTRATASQMAPAWWLGDLLGALVVYPFVFSWWRGGASPTPKPPRFIEAAALVASLAAVSVIIFDLPRTAYSDPGIRPYMVFPLLMWAALRFGPRATSSATLILSATAVAGAMLGRGVFARASPTAGLLDAQLFMGLLAGTSLVVGAMTMERNESISQVIRARASLESEVKQRTADLEKTLAEKEVLLREIHHRVKNNLQVIASLLHLQSAQALEPRIQAALRDSECRVKAVALIHEVLHKSAGTLTIVDMQAYLESLGAGVMGAMSEPSHHALLVEARSARLDVDTAIMCGLIVNELLSNALKHAFPEGRKGGIVVRLNRDDQSIVLEVADDGVGLSESIDFRRATTLGLRMVSSLTHQLGGSIELDRTLGTRFRIRFPSSQRGAAPA